MLGVALAGVAGACADGAEFAQAGHACAVASHGYDLAFDAEADVAAEFVGVCAEVAGERGLCELDHFVGFGCA